MIRVFFSLSMALTWNVNGTTVSLKGSLTEEADLMRLVEHLPGNAVMDLAGLSRINSYGVRLWLDFVRAVPARLILDRCSVAFVAQLNLIANFSGGNTVRSVYVPYICSTCEEPFDVLVPTENSKKAPSLPGPQRCKACGGDLEVDVPSEVYFHFLAATR
jgi:hypothetical protein